MAVEHRRSSTTNVGTETAFRHDLCRHFPKSKHLLRSKVSWCDQTRVNVVSKFLNGWEWGRIVENWTTLIYMLNVPDLDPKGTISEVRVNGCTKLRHAGRWSIAKCRFTTKESFDYHGKTKKEKGKSLSIVVSKNEKSWKTYEYVIEYACKDGCVNVEKVKSAKTRWLNVRQWVLPS